MTLAIRRADLEADKALLIESLLRFLTPLSDTRRYDWLYLENPHGRANVFVAEDSATGAVVGVGATIPRRLYVAGIEKDGCVLSDFAIHPDYRSLGPAVRLQRTCLESARGGFFQACYDFPANGMIAVYRRMGIEPREQIVRFAKPLRAERKIRERLGDSIFARGLRAAANRWLVWGDRLEKRSDCEIAVEEGPYAEEFSGLARRVSSPYGVCVHRSAEYLNWRYRVHPTHRYEKLTARRGGILTAYAVFLHQGEDGRIVDLFGADEPAVLSDLVTEAVSIFRRRGVTTVSAPMLASHPRAALLESLGFRARESQPVVTYVSPQASATGITVETQTWYLMDGDRES